MCFEEFIKTVSQAIINNRTCDDRESVECVWYSYSFGNIKAMLVVKQADGEIDYPYYEASYKKDTDDIWIKTYIESDEIRL